MNFSWQTGWSWKKALLVTMAMTLQWQFYIKEHLQAPYRGVYSPHPGQDVTPISWIENSGHIIPLSFQNSTSIYWPTPSLSPLLSIALTPQQPLPMQMKQKDRAGWNLHMDVLHMYFLNVLDPQTISVSIGKKTPPPPYCLDLCCTLSTVLASITNARDPVE